MLWYSAIEPSISQSVQPIAQTMVQEQDFAQSPLDSNTKYLYLSFDDGPLFGTSACITICENENVQASFFKLGYTNRGQIGVRNYTIAYVVAPIYFY